MVDKSYSLDSNQYNFISLLGKGSFSKVYQAECVTNNRHVAIKVMDLECINTSFEDILQEVQTMKLSDNNNILRCYCSFVESNQLWLVMQLMDLGSCLRVMNISKSRLHMGEGLNEEWIGYILSEAVHGLNYLHSNGQIHRDIKSGNILIDSQGNVRLADFGVSGWTVARGLRQDTVKTFVGTPSYMAPEVMAQNEGYDNRADIWSVGITALELAKGYAPYAHHSPMRVLVLTLEEESPGLRCYPDNLQRTKQPFSSLFEDFYKKCLQKNPKGRPTAEELLKHKFLKGRAIVRDDLVAQLLVHIGTVGSSNNESNDGEEDREKLPGEASVSVTVERWDYESNGSSRVFDSNNDNKNFIHPKQAAAGQTQYASGTSWVFDSDDINEWRAAQQTQGSDGDGEAAPPHTSDELNKNNFQINQSGIMHRVQQALVSTEDRDSGDGGPTTEDGVNTTRRVSGGSDSYKVTVHGLCNSNGKSDSDSVTFNRHTSSGIHHIKLSQSQSQQSYHLQSPFKTSSSQLTPMIESANGTSATTSSAIVNATNLTSSLSGLTAASHNASSTNPKVHKKDSLVDRSVAPEIDDFLSDFENEIVIPESAHTSNPSSRPNSMKRSNEVSETSLTALVINQSSSSSSSKQNVDNKNTQVTAPNGIVETKVNNNDISASTTLPSQCNSVGDESTASFMDELEDIVDGCG